MTTRQSVSAADAPKAIGPYSQAIWNGHELFCSGQTPIDPSTGRLIDGDVGAQTHRVFDNLAAVLAAAGLSLADVIKCNVYLTDMADFAAMNAAYGERFAAPHPARTTVAVAGLPLGARVEIECIARRAAA
ncbi:MAG: Rid family detoxifying hydrolase [Gemmatimonadaceae bacterium]|nr:Rid family detoxifying hydrolase [Gemmatimonadaceae bacterium]